MSLNKKKIIPFIHIKIKSLNASNSNYDIRLYLLRVNNLLNVNILNKLYFCLLRCVFVHKMSNQFQASFAFMYWIMLRFYIYFRIIKCSWRLFCSTISVFLRPNHFITETWWQNHNSLSNPPGLVGMICGWFRISVRQLIWKDIYFIAFPKDYLYFTTTSQPRPAAAFSTPPPQPGHSSGSPARKFQKFKS